MTAIVVKESARCDSLDIDVVRVVIFHPVFQVRIAAVQRRRLPGTIITIPNSQSIAFFHPNTRDLVLTASVRYTQ